MADRAGTIAVKYREDYDGSTSDLLDLIKGIVGARWREAVRLLEKTNMLKSERFLRGMGLNIDAVRAWLWENGFAEKPRWMARAGKGMNMDRETRRYVKALARKYLMMGSN